MEFALTRKQLDKKRAAQSGATSVQPPPAGGPPSALASGPHGSSGTFFGAPSGWQSPEAPSAAGAGPYPPAVPQPGAHPFSGGLVREGLAASPAHASTDGLGVPPLLPEGFGVPMPLVSPPASAVEPASGQLRHDAWAPSAVSDVPAGDRTVDRQASSLLGSRAALSGSERLVVLARRYIGAVAVIAAIVLATIFIPSERPASGASGLGPASGSLTTVVGTQSPLPGSR